MSSTVIDVSSRRAGIVGVSGYSGMELARILASHPNFSLGLVTSDKWAGKRLGAHLAVAAPAADLTCFSHERGQAHLGEVDVVFLCTPAEVSVELAPRALAAGARVVDLSGGFGWRLTSSRSGMALPIPRRNCLPRPCTACLRPPQRRKTAHSQADFQSWLLRHGLGAGCVAASARGLYGS